jgi:hypothetical protein
MQRQADDTQAKQLPLIQEVVQKQIAGKLTEVEKVTKNFSKFFNSEELQRILEKKVDKETLAKVIDIKASKQELDSTMLIVENIY